MGWNNRTGRPFGTHSDFDIAIGSSNLLEIAKNKGINLRSRRSRSEPIKRGSEEARQLGIYDLLEELSQKAGRDVDVMIYKNVEDAIQRTGNGIQIP